MKRKEAIEKCIEALKNGRSIICPTDSLWGLSCDACNEDAINELAEIKQRDKTKSYIVLVHSDAQINNCVKDIPGVAWDMIDYATSPLSLVLDQGQYVAKNALHPSGSIAIRKIKSGFCYELLKKYGKPIVSTSANFSGQPSALSFSDIDSEIIEKVSFSVPESCVEKMSGKASKIVKIAANGEVTILRK